MGKQDSLPVSPDPERTPSQPTKTRLWPIDTTSPMCEEDAVQQDQDFVEKHTKSLRSAIRTAALFSIPMLIISISFFAGIKFGADDQSMRNRAAAIILLFPCSLLGLTAQILAKVAGGILSRYSSHEGDSWTERSADRQRKLDAFEKRRFDLLLKCPAVTLLISFPLLICGVYLWYWCCHPYIPYILVTLAVPAVVLYLRAILVVASSW